MEEENAVLLYQYLVTLPGSSSSYSVWAREESHAQRLLYANTPHSRSVLEDASYECTGVTARCGTVPYPGIAKKT
jgi:hypothetical protein